MKIIKFIFSSLLAFSLIAGTTVFIFLETFDTDQYLPQITKKASFALGRSISIGHLGLVFSLQGIALDAGPVIIADDNDFTAQPFIKIDKVRISLDIRSLIFHREIHITGVLLKSPQIHFIRNQEGLLNIQSIGHKDHLFVIASPKGESLLPAGKTSPQENVLHHGVSVNDHETGNIDTIKFIKIQDAAISFIDQSQAFPLDLWLTDINANLDGFSLSKPFGLSLDASLYSEMPNVHLSSRMFLDLTKRTVQLDELKLGADLSQVRINALKYISPQMADSPFLRDIAGIVQLNITHFGIVTPGVPEVNGDLSITGGIIKDFNII